METGLSQSTLINHLLLVGPRQSVTFEPVLGNGPLQQDWHNITTPAPTILRCYPPRSRHKDIAGEVVYFCQPEGCCIELHDPKFHVFMLTDTETNVKTYGVCLTISHLFDPPTTTQASQEKGPAVEVVSIQEWGALSICLLSNHPFFSFFAKCLKTLSHFMEHFGSNKRTWNELLQSNSDSSSDSTRRDKRSPFVVDIENWINRLLELPVPEEGGFGMEVELEVEPEVLLGYPAKTRLPLFDLHLHYVLQRVGVHTFIEIFKLVLSEQKVILYSSDAAFSSECVFAVVALLYPLQYLYPVIPLLPSSMPTAENLLMVPTPYLIGVCDTFMKKVEDFQVAETWTVGLDTKQVTAPQMMDQPLLRFPLRILQLQADIRKALDRIHEIGDLTDGNFHSTHPVPVPYSQDSSQSHAPAMPLFGEDHPNSYLFDEVDISIRIAFVQFLFDPEILGHVDQHLCIYRLFPRPVVALRNAAFLAAYNATSATGDTSFIKELIKTQCVEYFFQYSLNPSNLAFEEIKRGVTDPNRLMDKISHSVQSGKTTQVSLYSHSPDSVLYQEMLSYKAEASNHAHSRDDSSDWEVLSGDNYDGDSEASSVSYFSEDVDEDDVTPVVSNSKINRSTGQRQPEALRNGIEGVSPLHDEVEVDYYTPKLFSRSVEEGELEDRTLQRATEESRTQPISPRISIVQQRKSSGSDHHSDNGRLFLTPDDRDSCSSASDVETGFRQRHSKTWALERGPALNQQHSTPSALIPRSSLNSMAVADHTPTGPGMRQVSMTGRGEKGSAGGVASQAQSPNAANSHSLELQIQELVTKVTDGHGIPWPKPAYLRRLAYQERSRVTVLRLLEEKLGVREPREMVVASSEQIIAVSVSKSVFKGVLELMKYLLLCVEEELLKEPESSTFSTFLILRIAFSIYLPPKPQKSTIGISLLNALNLSSFVTPQPSPEDDALKEGGKSSREKELAKRLPTISISDTDEETEELHFLRKVKQKNRRGSSPLVSGCSASDQRRDMMRKTRSAHSLDFSLKSEATDTSAVQDGSETLPDEIFRREGEIAPLREEEEGEGEESELEISASEGGGKSDAESSEGNETVSTTSRAKKTPSGLGGHERFARFTLPETTPPPHTSATSFSSSSSPITPSPLLERMQAPATPSQAEPVNSPPLSSPPPSFLAARLSPLEASVPPSGQTSPTSQYPSLWSRGLTPTNQPILLSELINSPRFYHPQEGQDLTGCSFLYKELMRSLGNSRNFMLSRHFWNQLFISTLTVDRECMGWNERTVSLYMKYNSLSETDRQIFGFEEDVLLSILLHNLLVCMLVVGLTPQETTEIIHRFSARTRLAIMEERLLQQTLKHVEQCIEEDNTDKVDINLLGLMALYSEVHPTVSYIIHYGLDVLAPVYKLQITDEVLILRRFPDDKICSRLWNDCISIIRYNKSRATVSICHKDQEGEYYHHFHTKQYMKVYESLQALVSPGRVESGRSKTSSLSSP